MRHIWADGDVLSKEMFPNVSKNIIVFEEVSSTVLSTMKGSEDNSARAFDKRCVLFQDVSAILPIILCYHSSLITTAIVACLCIISHISVIEINLQIQKTSRITSLLLSVHRQCFIHYLIHSCYVQHISKMHTYWAFVVVSVILILSYYELF